MIFNICCKNKKRMFLQGIPQWRLEKEVARTLQEVSLTEQTHKFAKHLSGGQKRKLSVAIAIIGDPKVCNGLLYFVFSSCNIIHNLHIVHYGKCKKKFLVRILCYI